MQQICHQHSYFKIKCDWLTSPSAIGGNLPSLVVSAVGDPWARHIQNESFSVFFVIWLFHKRPPQTTKTPPEKNRRKIWRKLSGIWLNFLRQFFPLNFPPSRWQDESSGTFCWCLFCSTSPPRPLKQTHNMLLSNILAYKIIVSPDDAGASPWGTTTKSHKTLFEHSKQ